MRHTKLLVIVALISLVGITGFVFANRPPQPPIFYPSLSELPCGSWMGAPTGNCVAQKPPVPRFDTIPTSSFIQQNDPLKSQVDDLKTRLDLLETKQSLDAINPK